MFGHIGMAQLRHHGAEVLNALDIVARQVGKKGFVVGQGVMHVAVDEAELGGCVAVCGWDGLGIGSHGASPGMGAEG